MNKWPRSISSPRVVNIEDLRQLAMRRLPRAVFDYLDGGAETETSLRENNRAFQSLTFRPRNAMAVPQCDLRTKVLGAELSFPAILAPIGYSRLIHPAGEVAASRGAGAAGTAYILSTIAGHKLEDVRAASPGPVWYQLYLLGGRAAAEASLERARAAGFTALFVTIDTGTAGMRERDIRNGTGQLMGGNWMGMIPYVSQFFSRPSWVAAYLMDGGLHKLPNVVIPGQGPMALLDVAAALAESVVTWQDFLWLRKVWPGPIVAKGVLTGDDARRAIDVGAAGVVVSNHGGRQLDGVSATLRVLPEIVKSRERPNRSSDGRRRAPRRRHHQSHLHGRARRSSRPRLRLRPRRRGSAWRNPSHRDPPRGHGTHHETLGMRIDPRPGSIVRRSSTRLAQRKLKLSVTLVQIRIWILK